MIRDDSIALFLGVFGGNSDVEFDVDQVLKSSESLKNFCTDQAGKIPPKRVPPCCLRSSVPNKFSSDNTSSNFQKFCFKSLGSLSKS